MILVKLLLKIIFVIVIIVVIINNNFFNHNIKKYNLYEFILELKLF